MVIQMRGTPFAQIQEYLRENSMPLVGVLYIALIGY
jgi:hypothetical protein